MRNALIDGQLVVTVDNSVAIGEKPLDAVFAPNDVVSSFTMRVLMLEQMCAGANINFLTMGNGSGAEAYDGYMAGIASVFQELALAMPQIAVSTETNMPTQQSALTITAIGQQQFTRATGAYRYVIGHPHVGQSVLQHQADIAPLAEIYTLWQQGLITHVWPTGSKGAAVECQRFFGDVPPLPIDMQITCGPSTVVLVYANEPLHLAVPHYRF